MLLLICPVRQMAWIVILGKNNEYFPQDLRKNILASIVLCFGVKMTLMCQNKHTHTQYIHSIYIYTYIRVYKFLFYLKLHNMNINNKMIIDNNNNNN